MGIIKAIGGAIGGGFADQWLEVIAPGDMSADTIFVKGVPVNTDPKRNSNKKGTAGIITNGSVVHVPENLCMILVDGGKVVDFSAEAGYYTVDLTANPSMFSGGLGASIKETFRRIKYGGIPSGQQEIYYINLQEIRGIKFGTRTPINYFDNFYNAELFLRAHGTYSVKVTDPLKFYTEVISKGTSHVEFSEINEQYFNEFLDALQSAINQMSAEGVRISHVSSKGRELSKYMSETLDDDWKQLRGMEVIAVGIASISYDEESQKLINMRNQGAMLSDPAVREGYVQGVAARSMEVAANNPSGAIHGFVGLGQASMAGGNMAGVFSNVNKTQIERNEQLAKEAQATEQQTMPDSQSSWACSCGSQNAAESKFCPECGKPKAKELTCEKCGHKSQGVAPNFCPACGTPFKKI